MRRALGNGHRMSDGVLGRATFAAKVQADADRVAAALSSRGGPQRVGDAGRRAGLIDEYAIVTHPVLVGGGTPLFTALDNRVNLNLVETRTFPDGVLLTRYESTR